MKIAKNILFFKNRFHEKIASPERPFFWNSREETFMHVFIINVETRVCYEKKQVFSKRSVWTLYL